MTDVVRDAMAAYVVNLGKTKGKDYAMAVVETAHLRFHVQMLKHTGHSEEALMLAVKYRQHIALCLHSLDVSLEDGNLKAFFDDCEGLLDIYAKGLLKEQGETVQDLEAAKELADAFIAKAMKV